MSWIMTVALGAAVAYFLIQFLIKHRNGEGAETPRGRLHRSATDKKIAGVCGGIGEYLNVDPTVIRLVTVLLVLGWGSGLLAYLICALVLPEE